MRIMDEMRTVGVVAITEERSMSVLRQETKGCVKEMAVWSLQDNSSMNCTSKAAGNRDDCLPCL